jgi:hypothetical protein
MQYSRRGGHYRVNGSEGTTCQAVAAELLRKYMNLRKKCIIKNCNIENK